MTHHPETPSRNVPAFRPTPGYEYVANAANALLALSADVEQGFTRLDGYPSDLPSLDELAALVARIATVPTLTHDQLEAFARMAGGAGIGEYVDGMGACAAFSIEARQRMDGTRWAEVRADGEVVARIAEDGAIS